MSILIERIKNINTSYALLLLFLLWGVVQLGLYLTYDIKTPVDAFMYIDDAESLLVGVMPEKRNIWYVSYSAFLALIFSLNGGLGVVVLGQVLLSGIAGFSLFVIIKQLSRQTSTALIGLFLYIAWVKIHQWNFYIYTESFFTSMCLLSFALLLKCRKSWHFALIAVLLAFTFFIRPTGFGFFVGLSVYFLFFLKNVKIRKGMLYSTIFIVLCFGVLLLNKMLENHILIESYMKAEIIYPGISLGVEIPDNLVVPPAHYPPVLKMFLFVLQNPLYFLKISGIKLFLFVSNVKPYFSFLHNLLIVCVLWPLYYFAYKGFRLMPANRKKRYFLAAYIFTQVLTVTLTTENWDGRFLVPVLPFVFILSAIGINAFFSKRILAIPTEQPLSRHTSRQ